jgi:GMP synthase-like glutamine amidotransferase
MHVLAFRHVPFEGLGRIAGALDRHGLEWRGVDLYAGQSMPDVAAAAGLILMGGPMSVNDDLPWLRAEEDAVRQAVAMGIPVLGVCLGAQLVARALGARVYRNPVKEIGWFEIELTREAAGDALFGGLAPRETVFHWHGETFDLPDGAVALARSAACPRQAFRAPGGVYGLQFHLETTPEMIADWCAQDANCGDMRELETPLDPWFQQDRLSRLADSVFGRWCAIVQSAPSPAAAKVRV